MAFADCNGIRTHFQIHGDGSPLILIAGLGGDHSFWAPALDALAPAHRVIVYDTRGSGLSDAPPGPYDMEQLADDLIALMDALDLPRAHVLGFSMGGNIAITAALRRPDRFDRLILAATHAVVPPQIRYFIDAVLEQYEGGMSARHMFALIAPWLFSNRFLSREGSDAYLAYDDNDPFPQPMHAWKALYLAQRGFDVRERLAAICAPTLVLCADEDPFAPLASAEELARNIPNAGLRVIAGSGHLMNLEHTGEFHRLILDFLKPGGARRRLE